jgi:hypothetical protein
VRVAGGAIRGEVPGVGVLVGMPRGLTPSRRFAGRGIHGAHRARTRPDQPRAAPQTRRSRRRVRPRARNRRRSARPEARSRPGARAAQSGTSAPAAKPAAEVPPTPLAPRDGHHARSPTRSLAEPHRPRSDYGRPTDRGPRQCGADEHNGRPPDRESAQSVEWRHFAPANGVVAETARPRPREALRSPCHPRQPVLSRSHPAPRSSARPSRSAGRYGPTRGDRRASDRRRCLTGITIHRNNVVAGHELLSGDLNSRTATSAPAGITPHSACAT